MKISVAMCTYNGDSFLDKQFESIITQNVLPDELVICDDLSTDATLAILGKIKEKSPFAVTIVKNEQRLGSTRNFEQAISLCSGDVIVLCDQDDVWLADKLEKIKAAFEEKPEIGYLFTDAELVDEELHPLGRSLWESFGFHGALMKMFICGEQLRCFLRRQQFVTGATMAFRGSLKKLFLPFPLETIWIHDGWIAVTAAAAGVQGLPLPEKLIRYRQHSAQQAGVPSLQSAADGRTWRTSRHAREKKSAEWRRIAESYDYLGRRLGELRQPFPIPEGSLQLIESAGRHLKNRAAMQEAPFLRRLGLVLTEAFSGRYRLFGNPVKSLLSDLA